jgi:hypothetical protein
MTISFYRPDREVATPGEMLDHGWYYLRAAIDLGQVVAASAARRAEEILTKHLEDRPEGGRVIPAREATELANLIAEIVRAASSIMDGDYQLRPEVVADNLPRLSGLVSTWDMAGGPVYSLANAIIVIESAEDLLRRAGAAGHDVDVS